MKTKPVGFRVERSIAEDFERFCKQKMIDKARLIERFMKLIVKRESQDELLELLTKYSQIWYDLMKVSYMCQTKIRAVTPFLRSTGRIGVGGIEGL